MIDLIVRVLITWAAVAATYALVTGAGKPPVMRDDGVVVLRPGIMYLVLGLVCAAFALFCLILGWMYPSSDEGNRNAWQLIIGGTGSCGIYLITSAVRRRVEVGPLGVCEQNVLGQMSRIHWREVREVLFSLDQIRVRGADTVVVIDVGMTGIPHFWNIAEANLREDVLGRAHQDFDDYVRGQNANPAEVK